MPLVDRTGADGSVARVTGTSGQQRGGAGGAAGVSRLEAVIFDVDGTLVDTERDGHLPAFNEAFARHGMDVEWDTDEYGRLLEITGGRRRVAGYLREHGVEPDEAERLAADVHSTKTALFREMVVAGGFAPRPGVRELVDGLVRTGIRIAVATTGRRSWVEPLIARVIGADLVEAMITGEDVRHLKPDPEAYRLALRTLGLGPTQALVVEDSAVGLRAATAAGLATVVVTNGYTEKQDFDGAAAVLPSFDGEAQLSLERCVALHERWWAERLTR
jgi:HAD superfamily hydrolase (TIGR01509 family)